MKSISRQTRRKLRKSRSSLIRGDQIRPRVVLSKSNRYLICQVIDDEKAHTLIYFSTANFAREEDNKSCYKSQSWAEKLGEVIVEKLEKRQIKQVVFDRNGYPYHGKVKSFGEIIKKKGLLKK